jgi:hypothetical protein
MSFYLCNKAARIYEVGYKGYLREESEWYAFYLRARDEQQALRKFARQRRIKSADKNDPESWRWEEGDWLMTFRYIKEVSLKPCPRCQGTGIVAVEANN